MESSLFPIPREADILGPYFTSLTLYHLLLQFKFAEVH